MGSKPSTAAWTRRIKMKMGDLFTREAGDIAPGVPP